MIFNEAEVIKKAASIKIDTGIYQLTTDKKGLPNVLFTGDASKWFIHSSYDAVKDGVRFAESVYVSDYNLVVFGLGLGYHIKPLVHKLVPEQKLYIFETNLSLLKIAFETTDIKNYLQRENVFLYAGENLKALQKSFYESMCGKAAFITYTAVMNTVPVDFCLVSKYYEICKIHADMLKNSAGAAVSISDLRNKFNYMPIKRAKKYKIMLIGYRSTISIIQRFMDNLKLAFEYTGCETVSISHEDFFRVFDEDADLSVIMLIKSCDFVVSCDISYVGSLFDMLKIPVISVKVDRPYAISPHIRNEAKYAIYTWTDQSDLIYAGLYYKHGKHYFMPHGAELNADPGSIFTRERVIDILVSCTYHTDQVFKEFAYKDKPYDIELINEVTECYRTSGNLLEDCVKEVMGANCDDETLYQFMHDVGFAIDITVRLENRYRVIKALLDGGLTIHLFGSGWNLTDIPSHPNCIYHGEILYEAGRLIFEHSKILINNLPAYQGSGAHERVFSSMIRGTLCVSNSTDYLRKTFAEDKEIVFYDNNDLDALVRKVKYYLNHEDERLEITKNALENVCANHTWINRADDIITMYEEFKEREGLS